jgi:hypothetical protein
MDYEQRKDESDEDFNERLKRELREKYPYFAAFSFSGPWTDDDDLWLEHMTGEPQGKRRVARASDL